MKQFFKIAKVFFLIALISLTASCSSEDDENEFVNLPSGEIVSLEARQITLTGFSENQQNNETQKWWKHVVSNATFSSSACGDDVNITERGYIAFYSDGNIYSKNSMSGSATYNGSWAWTNSNKTSIYVSNSAGSQEFTVTYLNDTNVVYGSVQSSGGCSVTTYEKFNTPFFE